MADARFEDGEAGPLRLLAQAPEDVPVIASLCQDAVFVAKDIRFDRKARRFGLLLNRYRWENPSAARPERVRSLLVAEGVLGVQTQSLPRHDEERVFSLLSVSWQPSSELGAVHGRLVFHCAGAGALALELEALDLNLRDVTRPYYAVSGRAPHHPDGAA